MAHSAGNGSCGCRCGFLLLHHVWPIPGSGSHGFPYLEAGSKRRALAAIGGIEYWILRSKEGPMKIARGSGSR